MAGLRRIVALLITLLLVFWPRPAWGMAALASEGAAASQAEGARLFAQTCAGCHPHGGNIIRRGRTLRESALRRQGIEGAAAVAQIAAAGIGRMDGYAAALGEGGAASVGGLVDAEHMGAVFGGAEGHQLAGLLLALQAGQVLLPEGGALLERVVAVAAPEHELHGASPFSRASRRRKTRINFSSIRPVRA